MLKNVPLSYSVEVEEAMKNQAPLVALESTIISHGMPWPTNFETALQLEQTVRDQGAVPATIATLDGTVRIGLAKSELEHLSKAEDVIKVSRRDLAWAISQKKDGATTVAATMICAHLAKINIFATGGIGGVHRDGENSLDISADLTELAQTPVAVVCAGAKSILDLGRTLEVLETHGVPVAGYKTDAFPAFYTRNSGHPTPLRLDQVEDIATMLDMHWKLGLKSGAVIANPIPLSHAMSQETIEMATSKALKEAEAQEIKGKEVTPFLLQRIKDLTGGASLKANIALAINNADLAGKLAVALQNSQA